MNKEKLQTWALIAEIIGGFAVVLSLILLLIGVRENTDTLKAATYDSLLADLGEHRRAVFTNDSLTEFSSKPRENLTPAEQSRVQSSILSVYYIFERAFIHWETGNLDENGWERFSRIICNQYQGPEFQDYYNAYIDQFTTQSFQNFRSNECAGET